MKKTKKEKQIIYKSILWITLPIVIQNLLSAAVNSADVVMLNYVGQSSLSAGSLATQYGSIAFMIFYGIGSGLTMLCAQYWGKGDLKTIHRIQGIALRLALAVSTLLFLSSMLIPNLMMKVFTADEELILHGVKYLRVVAVGYLFWGVTEVYLATLRSIGRVMISTVISSTSLSLNVGLNAVFIFGVFGLPKMGIVGVGLATTIARAVGFILCVIVSLTSKNVKIAIGQIFEHHKDLQKDFFKMSVPAIGNDLVWSLGFSTYSIILGHLGSDVVAANSIVTVVRNLGCTLCFAIGSATGIILGKLLGENQIEEAKWQGRLLLRLSIYAGVLGGVVIYLISPITVSMAQVTETSLGYLKFMLNVNTVYIMGTAVNTTLIVGVFRSGGDSRFGFICDTIDMWLFAIPLGALAAFVFQWPVEVVYVLLCTDEFVKWPWVFKNFFSYKWAKNITREVSE